MPAPTAPRSDHPQPPALSRVAGSWRNRAKTVLKMRSQPASARESNSGKIEPDRRTQATILLAHADKDFSEQVSALLREDGLAVLHVTSAKGLLTKVQEPDIKLVLLDRGWRKVSRDSLCREIRENPVTSEIPIILLSSENDELDRIAGFECCADDYVNTPCNFRELALRVEAVLRRTKDWRGTRITAGSIIVDRRKHMAIADGRVLSLTETELKLLVHLAERPDVPQSRESLLEAVWGDRSAANRRIVDTCIQRLRTKLGSARKHVKTVPGLGYCLAA
jgi:DNA-binding response OmpR family regulator